MATTLGISNGKFTINGVPTFLLGISYFDALYWRESDLDRFVAQSINCVRIFVDWDNSAFTPGSRSIFNSNGTLKSTEKTTIMNLIRACDARGIVCIVVIYNESTSIWITTDGERHTGVTNCVNEYKNEPNVMFDVCNEHNVTTPWADLDTEVDDFIATALAAGPSEIVFVSASGGANDHHVNSSDAAISTTIEAELTGGALVIAFHEDRTEDWVRRTYTRTKALRDYLDGNSHTSVPVFFTEPNRHGFTWAHSADEFCQAALNCKLAGGAGWVFHQGACFDMSGIPLYSGMNNEERKVLDRLGNVVLYGGSVQKYPAFTDTFTRANEGNPNDYNYFTWSGNGQRVLSNVAGTDNSSTSSSDLDLYCVKFRGNRRVSALLSTGPTSGGGTSGLEYAVLIIGALNQTGGFDNSYHIEMDENSAGTRRMRLYKTTLGSSTQLGTTFAPSSFGNKVLDVLVYEEINSIRFEVYFDSIRVESLCVSDNEASLIGKPMFSGFGGFAGHTINAIRWDNFNVGSLPNNVIVQSRIRPSLFSPGIAR